ncbi:MAG: HAMP domain-containing histidine kinase [Defluviitaleaceae bacterium]|nr:HAMP domain-containing histidine kinase [Defluviitaleaceae bacterium]
MKTKNDMAVRTFAFALILMTMVLVVILSILYFFLPGYYYRHKNRQLNRNAETLRAGLDPSLSSDEIALLLDEFSAYNNANVIAFDRDGNLVPGHLMIFTRTPEFDEPSVIRIGGNHASEWFTAQGTGESHQVMRITQNAPVSFTSPRFTSIILNMYDPHPEISHLTIIAPLQPIDEAQVVIISMLPYLAGAGFVTAFGLAFLFVKRETKRTEKLEAMKTDFLRAAGHELKTPIAALGGMLDGMMDEVGAYKNRDKYLAECKTQVERLSRLTADILKATRTEDTMYKPRKEIVDLRVLADELTLRYAPLTEKNRLTVAVAVPDEILIETDRQMFFTALSNLMSNAVKYTPPGGRISIEAEKGVFRIENECEIADPSAMQRWFEPFYRPDYSRDKSTGGTGLGLYLVKKNLDALKMKCELRAVEGGVRAEVFVVKICTN